MASSKFQPIQGMSDFGPPDIALWQWVEEKARGIFTLYGFEEVRTPILEYTEVFSRSLGNTTDVVQKEMYSFDDRGGRHLSLRPEGTAGIMRYVAGLGPEALVPRLYYIGPMFRCERPQAGRKRQFHQLGAETLGEPNPASDVESLALQLHLLNEWGLTGARVEINTRGFPEDRKAVADGLTQALRPRFNDLCEDCKRRFEANVLRILDCKQKTCGEIAEKLPPVTAFMREESRRYLDEVLRLLKVYDIEVHLNPRLVRGLDYYVHTVWEITHQALGAQDAISGGGRYQIAMGEKNIQGVGFAMGLERVLQALRQGRTVLKSETKRNPVWIVSMGDKAFEENMLLAQSLRMRGVPCVYDPGKNSVKSQMRSANRAGSTYVIIRGETEITKGIIILKNMTDGSQEELELPLLIDRLVSLFAAV